MWELSTMSRKMRCPSYAVSYPFPCQLTRTSRSWCVRTRPNAGTDSSAVRLPQRLSAARTGPHFGRRSRQNSTEGAVAERERWEYRQWTQLVPDFQIGADDDFVEAT